MTTSNDDQDVVGTRSLAERLGLRVRERRAELGLTLADVAERASLSISYLSAVEKGVNLPSLSTLVKITDALEVSIPTVLAEEGENRVRVGRLPDGAPALVDLSHSELQLRAQVLRALPGSSGEIPLPTKDHDLFVYVFEGDLVVTLAGQSRIALGAGDALDARSEPRLAWESAQGTTTLWTTCPTRLD